MFPVPLPANWEPQHQVTELKVVKAGSNEWLEVNQDICVHLPMVEVVSIERIQSKWLWERYSISKQRMVVKNSRVVNERCLYHGTSSTAPDTIYNSEFGFDFRCCRPDRLWGCGAYFAANAACSDRYAHITPDGQRQILVAKVLTGMPFYTSSVDYTLRKPPLIDNTTTSMFSNQHYDCICSNLRNSVIYIIYDHEKAYPSYLVTYRR